MQKPETKVEDPQKVKTPYQKPELKKHGKLKSTATATYTYTYTYIT